MTGTSMKYSAIASALVACMAFASLAEAGGYAGNLCVSKKQIALSKHASSVAKAWVKSPDAGTRDAAILAANGQLATAWTKAEENAVKKNASCSESTSDAATAGTAVADAIAAQSAGADAIGKYAKDAMKAWSKYIKDPTKDPGKAKLTEDLGKAVTKDLDGAAPEILAAATTLEGALVALTTTAPDYPTTFQQIAYEQNEKVMYGKTELAPACVDNTPYMFFARKGSSNNVLMYYQGGGACWNAASCYTAGTCKRVATSDDNPDLVGTGFGDYNNPENPFYDWSVVFVSYCSCDVHWGDNTLNYGPGTARHRGRINAMVAEKFAREHFVNPDRVLVTGSSAGSYGAIMNSYWLMKDVWPNADFSVIGDAGVGVITKDFLNNYMPNWGVEKHFPTDVPGVALPVQNLSIVDLVSGLAERFPNARFANYDSSYDGGGGSQSNFFQVMRHPVGPPENLFLWPNYWESACDWNACMREFKGEMGVRSNYRRFTGAGNRHTIFGSDKVYTETHSTTAEGDGVTFVDWVKAMIGNTADWVDVDCANPGGDCNHLVNTCQGGDRAGLDCTGSSTCVHGSCGPLGVCVGGDTPGAACTCPNGNCQKDPDVPDAPYNNDGTVTCAPTTCPCDEVKCPTP